MRGTSLILALALAAGACSSDSGKPVDPARLGVQIVSGDRQVAPVAAASGASQSLAGVLAQQLPDNLLPEPLVARITVDGQPLKALSLPTDPLSPSFTTLPSDVVVTYRVVRPAGLHANDPRHCGDSFVTSAKPDKDGLVTTYWERGTYAGECRMEVRLVVDGMPRVDTAFVVGFEPGAITILWAKGNGHLEARDTKISSEIDLRSEVRNAWDAYRNDMSAERITALPDSLVAWEWYDSSAPDDSTRRVQGNGWTTTVPDVVALGYALDRTVAVSQNKNVLCWYLTAQFRFSVAGVLVNESGFNVSIPEPPGFTYPEQLCSQLPPE
jgi:hypothetical protein